MPSLFSRLKGKDGPTKIKPKKGVANDQVSKLPLKPRWEDAYARKTVEPEEIHELVKACTTELKARGLDIPFLLLPFRPTSDPSAVRTFVRHIFDSNGYVSGEILLQELRMTEPMVISGVIKWCWSRLQGGVVGWDAYELFKIGEQDSNEAHDSFKTFIPISVENGARSSIIFDFFDLLSAIAAHGKVNGFGGRKLSRMASWWAFETKDTGNGFEGGYKDWLKAADATSHLFFAYLRSLSPVRGPGSIAILPMSLQKLLQETEYPPQRPALLQSSTNKVVMIVDAVSPTPFALLRRGSHFEYRDDDRALREFSDYADPVEALTDECRRVLKAISAANQTQAVSSAKHSTSLRDASWSRFEDIGFGSLLEEDEDESDGSNLAVKSKQGLRTAPASGADNLGRPTTPSWADFLSSGFVDEGPNSPTNILLSPDQILPPLDTNIRQRSSQSHRPRLETERTLEPGELASISRFDLDDSFWWVWMASLAPEETAERKSAFGRCAVIETRIRMGRWLVMEEIVKGAAAEPDEGAYIAEKKGFFSWTRRNKGVSRSKSMGKQALAGRHGQTLTVPGADANSASKTSLAASQQAKIQAAAQRLQERQKLEERQQHALTIPERRGRLLSQATDKTSSVFTLQPVIASEASPAMKWASKYDKEAIREAYLGNINAGRGQISASSPNVNLSGLLSPTNGQISTSTTDLSAKATPQPPKPSLLEVSATSPALPPKPVPASVTSPALATSLPAKKAVSAQAEKPKEVPVAEAPVVSEALSPRVPPKDAPKSPEPVAPVGSSPDGKRSINRLHKEGKEKEEKKKDKEEKKKELPPSASTNGGFRKLFNRKNRQSRLPENSASDVNAMLAAAAAESTHTEPVARPAATPEPVAPATPVAPVAKKEPVVAQAATPAPAPKSKPALAPAAVSSPPIASPITPVRKEQTIEAPKPSPLADPSYTSSVESSPRTEGAEARNAADEFSRFDQGPLQEQPAFVPGISDSEEDEAIPPPIGRQRSRQSLASPSLKMAPVEETTEALDRWAQIRKKAAERAAQRIREDKIIVPPSRTEGDDDTSGEETMESRVARIKARVAELTGNMEGVGAPGSRALPVRRPT